MTVWVNGSATKPTSTSGWGWYDPYSTGELEFHYGDDEIGFDWNCAPEAGTIVYARFNGAAGNDIRVQSDRDGTIFRMLHNADLNSVHEGMHVEEGQQLAPQGNTSTEHISRHTHFETWPGGNINNRVDPVPWMRARIGVFPAGGTSKPIPIIEKSETMYLIKHPNGQPALVGEFTFKQISAYTLNTLVPILGKAESVTEDAWTFLGQVAAENRGILDK